MKIKDLLMLLTFILLTMVVRASELLSYLTPKLVVGGVVISALLFVVVVLKEKLEDEVNIEKITLYNKVILALRITSWLFFLFYVLMVTFNM